MLLESLEVYDLRNLDGKLSCRTGLNILVGENGHGKTNWLEAICLLAQGRSFKTAKLSETIQFGHDNAIVTGIVRESPEITRKLQVSITSATKGLFINDKKQTAQRYTGNLHVVVFNSDELEIVRGTPEHRRRFLDAGIVSLHPPFTAVFADYNRVIKQKNALLQSARDQEFQIEKTAELLAPWNDRLAALAAKIYRGRVRFVERINEVLEKKLFGREEMTVKYQSSLEGKGDLSKYEELITERLEMRVQAEMQAGYSLIGVHRDDLDITFDRHDLRKYGSAGQQRSSLLLLQLANITVYQDTMGEYPLFLIDDIDAELDFRRIGLLLEYLAGKTQTFVTTSKESFVNEFGSGAAVFAVSSGIAKPK